MPAAVRNLIGVLASYIFVFGVIGVSTLLMRRNRLRPSTARKVIHIGVSHWWLIAMALIDDPWVASIGPASFIAINALALRFRLLPAMADRANPHNLGTVYFPLSLLVLVNLAWRGVFPLWVGAIASLVLGWGDGLAALVGERLRSATGPGGKSVAGAAAMFAASFAVTLALTFAFGTRRPLGALGTAAATAAAAALVEYVTPLGLDNITVPLATAALYAGCFA